MSLPFEDKFENLLIDEKLKKPVKTDTPRPAMENKPVRPLETATSSSTTDNSKPNYVADADCYNAAKNDIYTWSQTMGEIDICINLPPTVKASKDVQVEVEKKHISVKAHNNTILDGQLAWEIKKHETIWLYDKKDNKLMIAIEKVQDHWWSSFFEGDSENEIDTRKINCSRPMAEFGEEAQAKTHKLMYDNQLKHVSLPTSDGKKRNYLLTKTWSAEDPPLQEMPFDPSRVNNASNSHQF